MNILVLNCGSTSIKFKLFDKESLKVNCSGLVDHINREDASITIEGRTGNRRKIETEIKDYESGIKQILELLKDNEFSSLKSLDEIVAVGHRVAAVSEKYRTSMPATPEVMQAIDESTVLAPLHIPANAAGVRAIKSLLGDKAKQVVVFDTAFHRSIKEHAYMYALPYEYYKENGIRKVGFHGTSHRYASERACEVLNLPYNEQRIIVAHLGGGSSVSGIKNGVSEDLSLGMTSQSGIMMGTRTGDIDPGIIPIVMRQRNISIDELSYVMHHKSGLLGVSGISDDMREIESAAKAGNERAQLAMDMFAYQIKKQVGALAAVIGGLDILVFTGGIGENHAYTRKKVCENMDYLGFKLDDTINKATFSIETIISTKDSSAKVMVIPTDEELMIARDTRALLE